MNPTNKEMQLRKTCQLYMYVLVSQGKEIPYEIMECAHSYDYLVDCVTELSEALKSLDSDTFDKIVNNTESREARELAHWWEMYQDADRLRKEIKQTYL